MKKNKKSGSKEEKPKVHEDLEGFNIEIDSFGELKSTIDISKINTFLNKNVEDKKLKERKDYTKIKDKGKFKG